jgi:hypothetical protein
MIIIILEIRALNNNKKNDTLHTHSAVVHTRQQKYKNHTHKYYKNIHKTRAFMVI